MKKLLQIILATLSCSIFLVCTAQDSTKSMQDSTRYKYFLGTNFDFIDGVEAQKLYHHINISVPDAFSPKGGKFKKIGFIAGLYQTRQVSNLDTVNYLNRSNNLREQVAYPGSNPNNVRIVLVDSVFLNKETTTNALGAYLQPTFLFGNQGETNIYFLGHFEYTRRKIAEKYKVSSKATDTLTIPKTELSQYVPIPANQTIKQTQDEGYFGIGAMLYHKNRFVELTIKGIAGAALLDKWRAFYGIDASIMILKGNFELGLFYKGLLPNYPPYFLNVHLTKVFYLDKIGELLK